MKNGCLRGLPLASLTVGDFCHSYQPSAGTRQRRVAAALANDAFSSTDSARALIICMPTLVSLAQLGTRPQVSSRSWRTGGAPSAYRSLVSASLGTRLSTIGARFVGAMLKSGVPGGGVCGRAITLRAGSAVRSCSTSNSSMSSSGLAVAAYRPHMLDRVRSAGGQRLR